MRVGGVAQPVGHEVGNARLHRVNKNAGKSVGEQAAVGEPAAVGRPRKVASIRLKPGGQGLRVHQGVGSPGQFQDPELAPFVRVGQPLAVRGPDRGIVKRGGLAEGQLADFAQAAGASQMQRVFARLVGEISDPLAVGRPRRVALRHAGGLGEVAGVPFLRGHRQNLPARFEHRALPGGREPPVAEVLRLHFLKTGPHFRPIPRQPHIHRGDLAGGRIIEPDRIELGEHDRARSRARGLDVQTGVFKTAAGLLRAHLISIQSHRPGLVGEKVNRVAHPQRIEFARHAMGQGSDGGIRQIREPDSARLPAAIPFPRALPLQRRHIGQAFAIR